MSQYLVLGRVNSNEPGREDEPASLMWRELVTVEANSSAEAIRKVSASEQARQHNVFLAVPERSYQPLSVERVETVQVKVTKA